MYYMRPVVWWLLAGVVGISVIGMMFDWVANNKILLILSVIPATLAKNKGKSWLLWYVYAVILWPVSFIHVLLSNRDRYGWVGEKMAKQEETSEEVQIDRQVPVVGTDRLVEVPTPESHESLMAELNALTGLTNVKVHLESLFKSLQYEAELKRRNLPPSGRGTLHMVFTGNPGTGKTTVARLVARIFREMGIISKGTFVEVDRSKLVGRYIGETAQITNDQIQQALGGVLFIDEAYTLHHDDDPRDFGQEAIETIMKAMEDYRDSLVVIVAGYTKEMEHFMEANPGLKSRFSNIIEFDDYQPNELVSIFYSMCSKKGYILPQETKGYIELLFKGVYENKDDNFGNAREVRNIFEKIITAVQTRVVSSGELEHKTDEELMTMLPCDITAVSRELGTSIGGRL